MEKILLLSIMQNIIRVRVTLELCPKNLHKANANNQSTDQPAHPCRLTSTLVVWWLESHDNVSSEWCASYPEAGFLVSELSSNWPSEAWAGGTAYQNPWVLAPYIAERRIVPHNSVSQISVFCRLQRNGLLSRLSLSLVKFFPFVFVATTSDSPSYEVTMRESFTANVLNLL